MFWSPATVASGERLPFLFVANGAFGAGAVVLLDHCVLSRCCSGYVAPLNDLVFFKYAACGVMALFCFWMYVSFGFMFVLKLLSFS
jgi:hypothetical protein